METIEQLKEAIADHGIEQTLAVCIELIDSGYLVPSYPIIDQAFIQKMLCTPLIYLSSFDFSSLPAEPENP